MINDDDDQSNEMSDEEVDHLVLQSLENILNIAGQAAELQLDDASCEEIYAQCDLIAAYHGLERSTITVEENPDGSYTTRFTDPANLNSEPKTVKIPGSIRTRGKPKLRIQDSNKPKKK